MVRDRLVCGVNDIRIQNRLLQESKLTYDKAFKVAQSGEVAAKDAADLLKGSSTHNNTVVQHLHSKHHLVLHSDAMLAVTAVEVII